MKNIINQLLERDFEIGFKQDAWLGQKYRNKYVCLVVLLKFSREIISESFLIDLMP